MATKSSTKSYYQRNKKYREKLSRLSSERRLSMPNGIFEAEVENERE